MSKRTFINSFYPTNSRENCGQIQFEISFSTFSGSLIEVAKIRGCQTLLFQKHSFELFVANAYFELNDPNNHGLKHKLRMVKKVTNGKEQSFALAPITSSESAGKEMMG